MGDYIAEHVSNIEHCPFCASMDIESGIDEGVVVCNECKATFIVSVPNWWHGSENVWIKS